MLKMDIVTTEDVQQQQTLGHIVKTVHKVAVIIAGHTDKII